MGIALDNIAMGIALGAGIGLSMGIALTSTFRKEEQKRILKADTYPATQQKNTKILLILGVIIVFICCIVLGLYFLIKIK